MRDDADLTARKLALARQLQSRLGSDGRQPAGAAPAAPPRELTPLQQALRDFDRSPEVAKVLGAVRGGVDLALGKNVAAALAQRHTHAQNFKVVGIHWAERIKDKIESKLQQPFGPVFAKSAGKSAGMSHGVPSPLNPANLPRLKPGRLGITLPNPPKFARTLKSWNFNIAPHGAQPSPRPLDRLGRKMESHHLESQTHLGRVIANYSPHKDWTILLTRGVHDLTKKPQFAMMHAWGYSQKILAEREKYFKELGNSASIAKAFEIAKNAGVPAAKAYQAVLQHDGYLKGTTPLGEVGKALKAYWSNRRAYNLGTVPKAGANLPLRKYWIRQRQGRWRRARQLTP